MNKRKLIHGIDPYAPGGIDALIAHHRLTFGDAVMMADGEGGDRGEGGDDAGTPAAPAAPGTPEAPPAAAKDAAKADEDKGDLWDDPAKAKAEIERLRAENGRDRTAGKTEAAKAATDELTQKLAKALGLVKDDDEAPDASKLTAQLTEREAQAKQAQTELAVYKLAGKHSGDADALLDSRSFLAKIADIDPTDTAAIDAAVKQAVTENPKLKSAQAAGRSGAEFNGGSGEGTKKAGNLTDAVSNHYARN